MFGWEFEVAREEGPVIRIGAGAVVDEILAPVVPDVAVRVGEGGSDVGLELLGARLVAIDGTVGDTHGRAVSRLNLRVVERPFLKVERSAWIEREAVGGEVRVRRV